ncbi:unnamed protein product [Darwinula stevensoni]|uniref:Uncharacterized protein n=1 Tax=Darwinula stevensoni TaxID=69355 RepID=A0A7R8XB63_9CRUS|nr:unnamed protein product [Darwinula stevensoni]CAG0886124.1 unnamed protein product [Darwinula stevensoni]
MQCKNPYLWSLQMLVLKWWTHKKRLNNFKTLILISWSIISHFPM